MDPHQDERITDWFDDRMTDKERERFEAELGVNPELREAADRYRETVEGVRRAMQQSEPPPSEDLVDRIMVGVSAQSAPRFRVLPWVGSAVAAAALVLIYFGLDWLPEESPESIPAARRAADDTSGIADSSAAGVQPKTGSSIDELEKNVRDQGIRSRKTDPKTSSGEPFGELAEGLVNDGLVNREIPEQSREGALRQIDAEFDAETMKQQQVGNDRETLEDRSVTLDSERPGSAEELRKAVRRMEIPPTPSKKVAESELADEMQLGARPVDRLRSKDKKSGARGRPKGDTARGAKSPEVGKAKKGLSVPAPVVVFEIPNDFATGSPRSGRRTQPQRAGRAGEQADLAALKFVRTPITSTGWRESGPPEVLYSLPESIGRARRAMRTDPGRAALRRTEQVEKEAEEKAEDKPEDKAAAPGESQRAQPLFEPADGDQVFEVRGTHEQVGEYLRKLSDLARQNRGTVTQSQITLQQRGYFSDRLRSLTLTEIGMAMRDNTADESRGLERVETIEEAKPSAPAPSAKTGDRANKEKGREQRVLIVVRRR